MSFDLVDAHLEISRMREELDFVIGTLMEKGIIPKPKLVKKTEVKQNTEINNQGK